LEDDELLQSTSKEEEAMRADEEGGVSGSVQVFSSSVWWQAAVTQGQPGRTRLEPSRQ
jgi:hypothetical protein